MKVLVTGSKGLIGRAVCEELRIRGHEVEGVDRADEDGETNEVYNLLNFGWTRKWMRGMDAVVHLAGNRASVAAQRERAADLLLDNIAIDEAVLRAAREVKIQKLVYASTVSVYPEVFADQIEFPEDIGDFVYKEEHAHAFPADSVRYSAWGKLTAERMIEAVRVQDKLPWSVVRLVNTYGPHDYFGPDALVIPSLIRRVARGENSLSLQGADNERDFLYVDDAAEGIACALEHPEGDTWNLGTGRGETILNVASMVLNAFLPNGGWNVQVQPGGATGASRKVVDPSKAKRELGWGARTPLAEGIAKTVEWYKANRETARG